MRVTDRDTQREDEVYLTSGEVAKLLGVSLSTATRWAREGKLPAATRTAGGHRRHAASQIQARLAEIARRGQEGDGDW